ncbi:MAG: ABC transporter ATP-binding protein [bacterium]
MEHIVIENLRKVYLESVDGKQQKVEVLDSINLKIKKGEFVTFFGPNGCGKTTLLNIIAGLLNFDEGTVEINGKHPEESKISFIFQNYRDSLLPWKKSIDNISFPLELQRIPRKQRYERVRNFLDKLGLKLPDALYPYQISGGQQQLLAIIRALIYDPDVLLMDEPFGSLDYQTRIYMQNKILDIWEKTKKTVLFVSHEIDEAIYLADRIVLFSNKPTKIIEILENTLPRPRNHSTLELQEFFILKTRALRVFKGVISQ